MEYTVLLTRDAESDLEDIYDYITESDSLDSANYVFDQLQKTLKSLSHFPERGAYPHELQELGIHSFRQTFFKPYRIIYQISQNRVYVYLIVDGRRDMQTLLAKRLLSGG